MTEPTNKTDKNVSSGDLSNAQLLSEAVKVIEFYAENRKIEGFGFHEDNRKLARDFLAKIEE